MKLKAILILTQFCLGGTLFAWENIEKIYYTADGCQVYDEKLVEVNKKFGKFFCTFFRNGDYLSMTDGSLNPGNSINYISRDGKIVWSKKLNVHHDIEIINNEKNILTIGSEFKKHKKKTIRYDIVYKLDKLGNIKFEWKTYDFQEKLSKEFKQKLYEPIYVEKKHKYWEKFHLNSARVIGKNVYNDDMRFRKGNILLSFPRYNSLVIINPLTSEIVWSYRLQDAIMIHDASMASDGLITFFVNDFKKMKSLNNLQNNKILEDQRLKQSAIYMVNPKNNKVKYKLSSKPEYNLYSKFMGGVQRLNKNELLITLKNHTAFIIKVNGEFITGLKFNVKNENLYRVRRILGIKI